MVTQVIWNNFSNELLGFIKARINNAATAEDILQDVFIKIHLHAKSLSQEDKLASWLYQITRNTIIDYYRKKKLHLNYEESFKENLPENPTELHKDFTQCLNAFIHQLPEKYKDILHKTTYENISQKEYATQMNLSYSAAKSRMQRARKKLKDLFVDCCAVQTDQYGNLLSVNENNCKC